MICDLAQFYNILNYRELPPGLVATLVWGLEDCSRVKKYFAQSDVTLEQILLASLLDKVDFVAWTFTKEAHKGKPYNHKSMVKALRGEYKNELNDNLISFENETDLMNYLKRFEK